MSLTDQEEKDRHERQKVVRAQRRKAENNRSSDHHSRMYRHHDDMARTLSKAITKSPNKELKRQHAHHVARCKHHETRMYTWANRDDDSD